MTCLEIRLSFMNTPPDSPGTVNEHELNYIGELGSVN